MPKKSLPATADPATKDWPPVDVSTVGAPKTFGGRTYPDLASAPALRNVSLDEARARGWPHFWDGSSCRYGHTAARWVSNPDRCSDCVRLKKGQPALYGVARHQRFDKPHAAPAVAGQAVIAAPAAPAPDKADQRYLSALAEHRDHARAAEAVGSTVALIEARRVVNPIFDAAVDTLESRLQIKRRLAPATPFIWSESNEDLLVRVWVDTGDLAAARDAIGCPPSDYFAHLANSLYFTDKVDSAAPLAAKSLEDKAYQLALAGNDKLLQRLLAATQPEKFGDRLNLNVRTSAENLTDDQLRSQIAHMLSTRGYRIIDGQVVQPAIAANVEPLKLTDESAVDVPKDIIDLL